MKTRYLFFHALAYLALWVAGVCVAAVLSCLLAGCSPELAPPTDPEATVPLHDPRTRREPDTGPKHGATTEPTREQAGTPPTLPVNPSRRDYKAYKRQLAAWEAVQKEQAKAQAGPKKLAKGATYAPNANGSVLGGNKPTQQAVADSGNIDQASTGRGIAQAGEGNTAELTDTKKSFLDYLQQYGAQLLIGGLVVAGTIGYLRYRAARKLV